MDTLSAFAMGRANKGKELKVFDWDQAALLIREAGIKDASAGLRGDWECTGGVIFEEGKPVKESDCYLASNWAIPEIQINGDFVSCYKMQSKTPNWDSSTFWPESALKILENK